MHLSDIEYYYDIHHRFPDSLTTEQLQEATDHINKIKRNHPPQSHEYVTSIQLNAIKVILDNFDNRPVHKKLQDLNIPTQTYQQWLLDPKFQKVFHDYLLQSFQGVKLHIIQSMLYRAVNNDPTALEFILQSPLLSPSLPSGEVTKELNS